MVETVGVIMEVNGGASLDTNLIVLILLSVRQHPEDPAIFDVNQHLTPMPALKAVTFPYLDCHG